MRHPEVWLAAVAVLSACSVEAPVQTAGDWVGTRVVLKSGNTPLKLGHDQVVAPNDIHRVYTVERVNGPWLWVTSSIVTGKVASVHAGVSGWVKASDVVPYDQANDYFTSVIKSNPSSWAYIRRGDIWLDKKEYDRALRDFNEAIRLDPKNAAAYICRGTSWFYKKKLDKALADYNEAIRLDPKHAVAYFDRSIVWFQKKELDKVLADCSEVIRLDPKYAVAYIIRGHVWFEKRELDKALAGYNESIRLDPIFAPAYIGRGHVWFKKRELDKALADYNEASRLDPKDPLPYIGRGNFWRAKKKWTKALADYNEASRLDPKHASPYIGRGNVWFDKKEWAKALADYNEASRLDPKDSSGYNGRAWIWATCPDAKYRDGKRAVESATRAYELTDWKDAGNLSTLAAAYAESGDFVAAVKWQEEALGVYKNDKDREQARARLELYRQKRPYRVRSGGSPDE
jgi:tetratricopeptide (TPR) repeat protein